MYYVYNEILAILWSYLSDIDDGYICVDIAISLWDVTKHILE